MKKLIYIIPALFLLSFTNSPKAGYSVGDTASDFSLLGTDSQYHSLSEMTDVKGYIVIFTCNHCPYSKAYEDRIIQLQTEFGPQGYPVVAINPNDPKIAPGDSYENMKKRYVEKGFNFPYLFDEKQTVYPKYGATKTPHVFLLDEKRVVKYIGAIDDNVSNPDKVKERYLANAIAAVQKGQNPEPNQTKAIGCSIKAKK